MIKIRDRLSEICKFTFTDRCSLTKVLQHLISMKLNANYPTFVCCVLGYMRGSPKWSNVY
ncbi:unnamed protein product [Callosobruchus maculatus]|uniref:Uncharacterized protein n=1 Tax=Callosobruchus maculatus TaxID=64391 RepID=A0A653CVM2_CALMS|nr:unnamed protein product [Callosobruchus maculatus]